jgi:signal transduction histidine kinase
VTAALEVALIAALTTGVVGLIGAGLLYALRRASLRITVTLVAVTTALAVVAAVAATAQAMFLDAHDLGVVVEVTVVAGAVSTVLALVLARWVIRGSRELATATRDFGTTGAFAAPADPPTAELAELARELAATDRRLAESRERERALESSRRELVAWVSHDLRTPLAGLRAMAEALEDGVAADPVRYHRQIRAEVDRLAGLVDDLFELSRIQSGTLQLTMTAVPVADLVSDALSGADALAKARGVRLAGTASGPIAVRADSRELSRVLTNLVLNAIRHTPADGTVAVDAGNADGATVLAVTDGCGGIPDADLARVFDVGWRGTEARTPGPQSGAGLGLAIARGIVEAHAGSITVANTGRGCRFEVRLPSAG